MRGRKRAAILLGIVAVMAGSLLIGDLARGDGTVGSLNFICQPTEEGTPPTEEPPLENGGVQVFNGIDIVFNGVVPAGVPTTRADNNPATPETEFQIVYSPTPGDKFVDFLSAKGAEIQFRVQPRLRASEGFPNLHFLELLHENFDLPFDLAPNPFSPNNNISVLGLDLIVIAAEQVSAIPGGFRGEIQLGIKYRTSDHDWQNTRAKVSIDGRGAGAAFPRRLQNAVVFKQKYGLETPESFWAYGQFAEFWGAATPPAVNQPGVQVGFDLDTIGEVGGVQTFDPMISLNTAWNATPRNFAIGVKDACAHWDPLAHPSEAHIAWNTGGLPDPSAANLGVLVREGIGTGLPITIDEGSGPVDTFADQTYLDASIQGVPERLDARITPDAVGVTRSPDVTPTLNLDALQLASDDPDTEEDLPIHVEGQIVDLPRHTLFTAGFDAEGSINKADVSFWKLNGCEGETPLAEPAAPDEARHLDVTQANPKYPHGCVRHSFDHATQATALLQNHLPQDLNAADAMTDIPEKPWASGSPYTEPQYLYYAKRTTQDLSSENELYRYGARLNGVERVFYDASEPPVDGEHLRVYGQRNIDPAADDALRAVIDVDGRTDLSDPVANDGTRIEVNAVIPDFPDQIRADYVSEPAMPLDVIWRATDPISIQDGLVDLQLPGPSAIIVDAALETDPVGPLPPAGEIKMTETDDGSGNTVHTVSYDTPAAPTDTFPTPTVPPFDPLAITRVHLGATVSTADWRTAGDELRVHAILDVPQDIFVEWETDPDDNLNRVEGVLCPPDNDVCEDTVVDATGFFGAPTGATDFGLLVRPDEPPAPALPPWVEALMPPLDPFRPDGTGIRVILLDDSWYADARFVGVESFIYEADPLGFGITFANDSASPFRVQLVDYRDNKVKAIDILLSALPKAIRVRLQDNGTDSLQVSFYGRSEGPIANFNIKGTGLFADLVTGEAMHITADTTIPVWPMELRLDYLTTPDQAFDLQWRATNGLEFADTTGSAKIITPPEELRIDAAVDTTALPPLGEVSFTDTSGGAGGTRREVQYKTPAADPGDDFPTPTIPAYDADALTNVHAGAKISTQAMRDDGVEIRGHVNINVPVGIAVAWEDDADGNLVEIDADVCPSANPNCATSVLDATALYGPPTGAAGLGLLAAPAEPAFPAAVDAAVPDFDAFRPGNGARIELLEENLWYGDVRLQGLHHVTYTGDPQDVTVDMADTGQPFAVQLLVATLTAEDVDGVDRQQVLWLNSDIDDLPTLLSARIEEDEGVAGEGGNPWLWVNTEDPAITDIGDVDFGDTDPPGTRPELDAHLRYGDIDYLGGAGQLAPSERPFGVRTTDGADVWGHVTPDLGRLAIDVGAQLEIPRHVALWKPASIGCNELSEDVGSCQEKRLYEIDDTQTVDLEFKTTSGTLGEARADVRLIFGETDFDIHASIETVPGQIEGHFVIASNQRLPWTNIDVVLDANAPLGDVIAEVFDNGVTDGRPNSTCYRQDAGDSVPGSDKSHPCADIDNPALDPDFTANFALNMQEVPASLTVNTRIVALEGRLTPGAGDPGGVSAEDGGLGYAHASLDLNGTDNTILLDVAQLDGGALTAIMRAESPINGFINGRMDHIGIGGSEASNPSVLSEGLKYLFLGPDWYVDVLSWAFLPLSLPIAIIVLALFDGDFHFNPDLDFDLPVYVEFNDVTDIRLGIRGTTVSLDKKKVVDGGVESGGSMSFGARQRALPHEEATIDFGGSDQKDGVFFHHRNKRSGTDFYWGWDSALDNIPDGFYSPTDSNTFDDIGIYDWETCNAGDQDEDPNCYNDDDVLNVASMADHPSDSRGGDFTSSNMMWDPFITQSVRGDIDDDEVLGSDDVGVAFYEGITDSFPAFQNENFTIPQLQDTTIRSHTDSLTADLDLTLFPLPPGGIGFDQSIIENDCEEPQEIDENTARGSDGTLYRMVLLCRTQEMRFSLDPFTPSTLLLGTALSAVIPNNGNSDAGDEESPRWTVTLPEAPGFDPEGDNSCESAFEVLTYDIGDGETLDWPSGHVSCTVDADIQPQADGSVQVTLTTTRTAESLFIISADPLFFGTATSGPTVVGTTRAWLDASGHPAFHLEDAGEVADFSAAAVADDGDGNVTLNACTIAPSFGCDPLPAGHSVRWIFGDGQISDPITGDPDASAVTHQYPAAPGTYLGVLVHFDDNFDPEDNDNGNVVEKRYFRVTVP